MGGENYPCYTDGSQKSDENERIANIMYDSYLKQPKEIYLTDGTWLKHYYDGNGTLLKTVYSTGEYWEFGGIIYKNGQPYQMAAPEGRAIYLNGSLQYEFFYTDHLGNTRVAFRANSNQLIKSSETAFDPWGVVLRGAGQVNGVSNRFEYQNKESEKTFGLNRINLGARTYNPTIGRMDRIDNFADKYFGLSTFQYSANNPMRFIDVNGDSLGINVIQGGGKNGRDLYQITITGKVVDNTTKGLSPKQLKSIANQISKQFINSFTGKDKNIEFTATANISVESSTNPLSSSDHAFRIVDDVATAVGQQDPPGGNIEGYGPVGQNVVYIEKGGSYARTGTHELGHSSGLGHIKSLTEVQNGKIVPLTTNDYFGNLMHQAQDVNSQGQPVAGTSIQGFQVREMYRLYKVPALNRGKQK